MVCGYTFRGWVSTWTEGRLVLWCDHNRQATAELRIEELKNDLAAKGIRLQGFFPAEATFLAVRITFTLPSLDQHQTTHGQLCRQLGTLRTTVFWAGAVLGRMGRGAVVRQSAVRAGPAKHKPLVERVGLVGRSFVEIGVTRTHGVAYGSSYLTDRAAYSLEPTGQHWSSDSMVVIPHTLRSTRENGPGGRKRPQRAPQEVTSAALLKASKPLELTSEPAWGRVKDEQTVVWRCGRKAESTRGEGDAGDQSRVGQPRTTDAQAASKGRIDAPRGTS